MLVIENVTALIVFALWVVGFALGYALRNRVDEARTEFTDTFTYRQRRAHAGEYRQIENVAAHGVGGFRS